LKDRKKEMIKMRKKLFVFLFVVLVVIMVVSVMAIPALARSNGHAEGVWSYLPAGPPVEDVIGPHTFMTLSDAGEWTGSITGHADDFGEAVIHSAGPWYYWGTVPFESATVKGKTGGLMISVYGSRPNMAAEWEGTWEITSGTGDLAGVWGQGTWEGPGWQGDPVVPGLIYYSGKIHLSSSNADKN
jgi:hypothetical protein